MISIPIEVAKNVSPPDGKVFDLRVSDVINMPYQDCCYMVNTGLKFQIPDDCFLQLESTVDDVLITSHTFSDFRGFNVNGNLMIVIYFGFGALPSEGEVCGKARIVSLKGDKIRFVQTEKGARVIRGDAMPVQEERDV